MRVGLRTIFAYILVEMVVKNYFTSAEPESTRRFTSQHSLEKNVHAERKFEVNFLVTFYQSVKCQIYMLAALICNNLGSTN